MITIFDVTDSSIPAFFIPSCRYVIVNTCISDCIFNDWESRGRGVVEFLVDMDHSGIAHYKKSDDYD